eukprot:7559757-Ditylum_brightwellii.AAC.1
MEMRSFGGCIIEASNKTNENARIAPKRAYEQVDHRMDKGVNKSIIAHKNRILTAVEAEEF